MKDRNEWLIPLTGVVFLVLAIVTIAIGGEPPEAKEGAQKVVKHYVDNKDEIQISALLSTLAGVALIFFFGYLRKVLRAAEGENGMLSLVAFVGGAILATGIAIDSMIAFALAEQAETSNPPQRRLSKPCGTTTSCRSYWARSWRCSRRDSPS